MASRKGVTVYTQKQIIDEIAQELNIYPSAIEEVYTTLESVINKHLLEVEEDNKIEVRLFEGMKLECKLVPPHYHVHPIEGHVLVPERLKFNCKITRSFRDNKNTEYEASRQMLRQYLAERKKFAEEWEDYKKKQAEKEKGK